jgi:hypothetical protein
MAGAVWPLCEVPVINVSGHLMSLSNLICPKPLIMKGFTTGERGQTGPGFGQIGQVSGRAD